MKRLSILLMLLFLTGCAASPIETSEPTLPTPMTEAPQPDPTETTVPATTTPPDPIQELLDSMTIEERVGQLFLARCNAESALTDIQAYHLGGFVLFGEDFEGQTPSSLRQTLSGYQAAASIPMLLAVDEEGGTVTRISRYPAFRPQRFPSPREAFADGGLTQALSNEEDICQLLQSLGINVNLGPVCDISEDPSAFMYQRSLGQDAETTGEFVAGTVRLMNAYQIGSVLKHFPGYGNNVDTHTGIARDSRDLATFENSDFLPFHAGFAAGQGTAAVLVSHNIVECMDPELPASLSPAVHRTLRDDLGFAGVAMTDDLAMDAVQAYAKDGAVAVLALQAGNDLIITTDYRTQIPAVLSAIAEGTLSESDIDAACRRVLQWKQSLNLLG